MEKSAWQQLEEEGYDMSLIEANLEASPLDRINNQSMAARSIQVLREGLMRSLQVNDRSTRNSQNSI